MATLFDILFNVDTSKLDQAKDKVKDLGSESDKTSKASGLLGDTLNKVGGQAGEAGEYLNKFNESITKSIKNIGEFNILGDKSTGVLKSFGEGLVGATAAAGILGAALATVGIGIAFKYADVIDDLNDLASMYGYTATEILAMKDAAERAGGSFEQVMGIYTKVAKAAYDARDANSGMGAAFKSLGVETKDASGELKSAQEITNEAIQSWNEGTQSTEQLAAMTKILGESWQKNLPALEATNEAQARANELMSMGIGISTQSTDATDAWNKALGENKIIFGDIGSRMVELVIPAFTNLVAWMNKSYESGGLVAGIFNVLSGATWVVMGVIRSLVVVFEYLDTALTIVGKGLGALTASLVQLASGNFRAAGNVWVEYFSDASDSLKNFKSSVGELIDQQLNFSSRTFKSEDSTGPFTAHGGGQPRSAKEKATKDHKILEAAGPELDMFQKYLETLDKAIEKEKNLNQVDQANAEIARLRIDYEKQRGEIEKHNEEVRKAGKGTLKEQVSEEQINREIELIKQRAKALDDAHAKTIIDIDDKHKQIDIAAKYIQTIEDEINHRHMTQEEVQKESAMREVEKQLQDDILKLKEKNLWTMAREDELRKNASESIQKITTEYKKLMEVNNDWVTNGINDYIKSVGTLQQNLEKLAAKGFQGLEDSIYKLITTGKGGFKELVASMLEDMAKLVFQLGVVIPLMNKLKESMGGSFGGGGLDFGSVLGSITSFFGFANGGAFDHGIQMFADGGIVSSPTMFGMAGGGRGIAGEAGPEAIMPLKRGADGKLGVQMSGGSTATIINHNTYEIKVSGATDPQATARAVAEQVKQIQTIADQRIGVQLKTGGMLNRATPNAF